MEIAVVGAGALAGSRGGPGRRVDVVVTTEPTVGAGAGRTFVAARAVGLLDLRPGERRRASSRRAPTAGSRPWRSADREALRLIHAQSFAREVRLIGR